MNSEYQTPIQILFYALTSAGPRGWCWTPSMKGEGFNDPLGVLQM